MWRKFGDQQDSLRARERTRHVAKSTLAERYGVIAGFIQVGKKGVAMETQELHRGRLIDHIQLVVADIEASRRFYKAIFEVLGVPVGGEAEDHVWADELFISNATSEAADGKLTGRHHLAFQAKDRAMVEAFYKAALANGGSDNGKPGERAYHPGYYAAFVLDPDQNNVEAVYHGPAHVSAPSVVVRF